MTEYEQKLVNWLRSEFKNRTDLQKKYNKIYFNLLKKMSHILDQSFGVNNAVKWDEDKVRKEALKHKTRTEFLHNSPGAYSFAIKNRLDLNDICKHMPSPRKMIKNITKEDCVKDSLKNKTSTDWIKHSPGIYKIATKNGWKEECQAHFDKGWVKESVLLEALKYKTPKEWQKRSSGSYASAVRNGWLEEASLHMSKKRRKTDEEIIAICLKYKNKMSLKTGDSFAYGEVFRRGLQKKCFSHMDIHIGKWNPEKIHESAKKYKTRQEWAKNDAGAYSAAHKYGIVDQCCKHMKRSASAKKPVKCSNGKVYISVSDCARDLSKRVSDICAVLKGKQKSAGGYTFKYVDEEE